MMNTLKILLAGAACATLLMQPVAAQPGFPATRNDRICESKGGRLENGNCVMPNAQPNTPAPNNAQPNNPPNGGQQGGRGGQPNAAPAPAPAPQNNAQQGGRGGQPNVAPQNNAQQGGGRGQPNNGQFGNNNNNAQQGGGQFGRGNGNGPGPQNNGQFGNNNNDRFDNNNRNDDFRNDRNNNVGNNDRGNFRRFDRRDNDRFDFERRTFGRDFERRDFSQRFYGRYGNDPRNFERERELFRARQNWREQYAHDYVYADDPFYAECRNDNAVGDALMGAIFGGFVGNLASGGRSDATVAGMVFGGLSGAALSRDLNCEDRYFVYRAYFDGFERGRPNAQYSWENPRSGRYGTLVVGDYYRDRDGFRCATFSQDVFIRGRREVSDGSACRQFDGTWVVVN